MDIIHALLLAALPVAALTFVITYFAYRHGEVRPEDDQEDEWDVAGSYDAKRPSNNYLHQKWMSFGGGYYGLMALLTLIYIEVLELYGLYLIRDQLPALLQALNQDQLIDIFVSQVMNMVDAAVWFNFWPDRIEIGNGWAWLGLSYAGYYCGRGAAVWVLEGRG